MASVIKKILLLSISAMSLFLSCTKSIEPSVDEITLTVGIPRTRVMLDSELHTVWNKGDRLSVFYKGGRNNIRAIFQGEDGDASGEISFTFDKSLVRPKAGSYAISPYDPKASIRFDSNNGDMLYTKIAHNQKFRQGSFGPDAAVLVSSTLDNQLVFYHATSVICLEYTNRTFKTVIINSINFFATGGESVCGPIAINMKNPESPVVGFIDGKSTVTLTNDDHSAIASIPANGSERFYFCVAPVVLSQGYCISIQIQGENAPLEIRNTTAKKLSPGMLNHISGSYFRQKTIDFDFNKSHWVNCPDNWFKGPLKNSVNGYTLEFGGLSDFIFITSYDIPSLRLNNRENLPTWIKIPCPEDAMICAINVCTNNYTSGTRAAIPLDVYSKINDPASGTVLESDCLASGSIAGDGSLILSAPQSEPVYLYTTRANAQISSLSIVYSETN